MSASGVEAAGGFSPGEALDALGDGVYAVDRNGDCISINRAALAALGYAEPGEVIGRNMHALIHHTRPDGAPFPQDECPLLGTARGGEPVRLENETLWRRDGTSFLAEYSSYPVLRDGGPVGSVITFNDSGVRRASQVRLEVMHAIGGVLAAGHDRAILPERILRAIGAGFAWRHGVFWRADDPSRPQPVASWHAAEPEEPRGTGPVPIPASDALARAVMETGRPALSGAEGAREGDAIAFALLAGRRVLGAVEFRGRNAIGLDDGLRAALAALGRQIGAALERHEIDTALSRAENRFRTIANAISQMAWMAEPDGDIVWYNDRWYDYTGTSFAEMAGWGWRSVHHPDHLEAVERRFRASVASGEPWEDTFPLRGRDGTYRWFLSRAMPILERDPGDGRDPSITGWFGTNTDITELRESEQALAAARDEAQAANVAKSAFMANMSHELRTPLSAIIGYTEMVVEEIEDGAEPTELVRDIRKVESNARHLLGLINDVLDLAKVESGKMEAYAEELDVATAVREVAQTVDALVGKGGNTLSLEIAPGVGRMHSDLTRIRQVLLNLLGNAAKFTENGRITLSVSRRGEGPAARIRFSVADTGIGMTPEQLARLFERFQQADASTTRQFGGTGLGLSLTRAFVELLGGEVEVSSELGVGSVFTVTLPATLPGAVEAAPPERAGAGGGARPTVLVIDDDAPQRELTARFLARQGYHAVTAADGRRGIALAAELMPQAILLDVTMPGLDGWSVLSTLKADPRLAEIPVVMVTFVSERGLAATLGASDYLTKPVDWDRLRTVLHGLLDAGGRILVVDDDADIRARLRRSLEAAGWHVDEAGDGEAALARVGLSIPDAVLLDLNMPVMDGYAFLAAFRERPGCARVPVVVLTASDLDQGARRRLRGASQILRKGDVGLRELAERLHALQDEQPA